MYESIMETQIKCECSKTYTAQNTDNQAWPNRQEQEWRAHGAQANKTKINQHSENLYASLLSAIAMFDKPRPSKRASRSVN